MRIAILRRNGFGDLILTLPLIAYLRKHFSSASLTLFIEERNAPLIPFLPPIEEIVVLKSKGNKYWNHLAAALKYRKHGFDVALSAKTSPMRLANFFLFALHAKKRIAYSRKGWDRFLLTQAKAYDEKWSNSTHQALKCLQLLAPAGDCVSKEFYPKLHIPAEMSRKYPPNETKPCLLISASTTSSRNRLDPLRYASLVNKLAENENFVCLVVSEKKDRDRAEKIIQSLKVPYQLCVTTSFEEFVMHVARADCLFVSDGGIAHIAAGLDRPQLTLFGSTSPILWRPLSEKCEVLYHPEHVDELKDEIILAKLREIWKRSLLR